MKKQTTPSYVPEGTQFIIKNNKGKLRYFKTLSWTNRRTQRANKKYAKSIEGVELVAFLQRIQTEEAAARKQIVEAAKQYLEITGVK